MVHLFYIWWLIGWEVQESWNGSKLISTVSKMTLHKICANYFIFCELKVNKSCITTQLLLQELIHYHEKNSWFFQPDQADIIALGKLYLVPVLMDLGALDFNVLNWGTAETIWILLQNGFTKNNIAAKNKEEVKNRGYHQIHCPCIALLVINWQSTAQPF